MNRLVVILVVIWALVIGVVVVWPIFRKPECSPGTVALYTPTLTWICVGGYKP